MSKRYYCKVTIHGWDWYPDEFAELDDEIYEEYFLAPNGDREKLSAPKAGDFIKAARMDCAAVLEEYPEIDYHRYEIQDDKGNCVLLGFAHNGKVQFQPQA